MNGSAEAVDGQDRPGRDENDPGGDGRWVRPVREPNQGRQILTVDTSSWPGLFPAILDLRSGSARRDEGASLAGRLRH
ncbi:hypothetical protein, partial [Stenotrophomonas maltophilia]|uniref:hypothetical protein n=1 Tax=Stenotrophomonas maltophilia TaxID=40324 RepID=UPI00195457F7